MLEHLAEQVPKFYGSVTVGERGQVSIPAEARRDLEITPTTKLLAFGGHGDKGLIFVKAEFVSEFITSVSSLLADFEQMLQASHTTPPQDNQDQ